MKSMAGLGVVLVDSDESQTVHEVCCRNIEAKFTARPRSTSSLISKSATTTVAWKQESRRDMAMWRWLALYNRRKHLWRAHHG